MQQRFLLNGEDWSLTGWYPNQWRSEVSMELGVSLLPMVQAIKAKVPGSVQTDLLAAGKLKDPNLGLSSLEGEWVTNREWIFDKYFDLPGGWLQDRCELVFEGLDYWGEIHLNGFRVAEFAGMFKPVKVNVTERLLEANEGPNHLRVIFYKTPEVDGQMGYSHQISLLKSRFNYAWDWCPRIVPVGIWRDVYLAAAHSLSVDDFYPDAKLMPNFKDGRLELKTSLHVWTAGCYKLLAQIWDDSGKLQAESQYEVTLQGGKRKLKHLIEMENVDLWWPNGYGTHSLYTVKLVITDGQGQICDQATKQIGFRSIEFIANEGAPESALPYTLLINGQRVFIKGINWVPISPFYGAVTVAQYEQYIGRFQAMNVNLLRVWGGGIIEKQAFYDYCDRNGLLVWQEFLQSSSGIDNNPPDNPVFLHELLDVARIAILEKRAHPSLIIWCSGNELMWDGFIPVDERHFNVAKLKKLVHELDPQRYFLPASASGPRFCASEAEFGQGLHHDVHGPWNYAGDEAHYRFFNKDDALFRSETGSPGISRVELLTKYAENGSIWPPTRTNPYWVHRGSWWIQWEELQALFGPWHEGIDEMGIYAQCSRYLQLESLRYAAEATRRREPQASGFIVWMGNEPFANNANTSLIEVDGVPKPAYYSMKNVFSSQFVSARYEHVAFRSGDIFKASIYLHNEQMSHLSATPIDFIIEAAIYTIYGERLKSQLYTGSGNQAASEIGELVWEIPSCPGHLFILNLTRIEETTVRGCTNTYLFTVDAEFPFEPLRSLEKAEIELQPGDRDNQIKVVNHSKVAAVGVLIREKDPAAFLAFDQNYVTLLPSETRILSCTNLAIINQALVVEGINLANE